MKKSTKLGLALLAALALGYGLSRIADAGTVRQWEAGNWIHDQISTPVTPASGTNSLYTKSDGNLYTLNSSGTEVQIGSISSTATLTNKTLATGSNHIVGMTAHVPQFNASTGDLEASNVTNTTLGYLDATSSIQTQLNSKQATGSYITALTGDVTASGPGSVAASVVSIGGVSVGTPSGTGNVLLSNSPVMVTPALGTPSALVGTHISGTAPSLTAGSVTTNANLTGDVSSSGNATTLATVATAGTTGSGTAIPVVTINVKGLTTGITTAAVVAPAGTLSGTTLNSGVTTSSLTSVGTLASLAVGGTSSLANATIAAGDTLVINGASSGNATLSAPSTGGGLTVAGGNLNASGGLSTPAGAIAKFNGSSSGASLSVANATGVGTTLFQAQIASVSSGMQIISNNSNAMDYKFNSGASNTTEFEISDITTSVSSNYPFIGASTISSLSGTSGFVGLSTSGVIATSGYDVSTATSGTITASANKPGLSITGAGGTTLIILLPSSPLDGQRYWICSAGNFTTVTYKDAGGTAGNVIGGQASIGGTARGQSFVYILGQTKWYAVD